MADQQGGDFGRRAFLGALAVAAAAQPIGAQGGGGRRSRGASPPIEVNPGDKGRLAVFNFSPRPVRGTMVFMDATTGMEVPESSIDLGVLPSRKGMYQDVIFPTSSMPPGTPNANGVDSWEIMGLFVFQGDTADVFGSVEVRRQDGTTVAHFRVEIEGVT